MNKEELNDYKDKLPPDMYVIFLKPDGEDGLHIAVVDTHAKGTNIVDLPYIISRGILSLLANDMDSVKERGQSVILEELRGASKIPVTDSLMERRPPTQRKSNDNIISLFEEDDEK